VASNMRKYWGLLRNSQELGDGTRSKYDAEMNEACERGNETPLKR
jgi:hypothetical protein